MAKTCTVCGAQIAEVAAFCTVCGAPLPADIKSEQPAATAVTADTFFPASAARPTKTIHNSADMMLQNGNNAVAGTGYFFWSMLLYSIPVVGFIVCLITAVAAKNENKRHFAKAILVWYVIGLVFAVIASLLIKLFGSYVINYIKANLEGQFGDLSELLSQFPSFGG